MILYDEQGKYRYGDPWKICSSDTFHDISESSTDKGRNETNSENNFFTVQ